MIDQDRQEAGNHRNNGDGVQLLQNAVGCLAVKAFDMHFSFFIAILRLDGPAAAIQLDEFLGANRFRVGQIRQQHGDRQTVESILYSNKYSETAVFTAPMV